MDKQPFATSLRGDSAKTTPRPSSGGGSRRLSRSTGTGPEEDPTPEHSSKGRFLRRDACGPSPSGAPRPSPAQGATPKSSAQPQATTPLSAKPPLPNFGKRAGLGEASEVASPADSLCPVVPRLSLGGADSLGCAMDDDPDSVQVMVRVRPVSDMEVEASSSSDEPACLRISGECMVTAYNPGKQPKQFTYDRVLAEDASQNDVFEVAGVPMVDNCMAGYNSSIFVYGQTGAGKTHTMMGELSVGAGSEGGGGGDGGRSEERGLAPRMIELLFERISAAEDSAGRDTLRYSCRCSCLEIYNETITDLLNPSLTNLAIREDQGKGVYVEGVTEKEVLNVDDVMTLMVKGNKNRHVGETNMNARSSRSHCVFTCVVERSAKGGGGSSGVTGIVCSRLNLIDLAGSERIKGGALGGSGAVGEHFNEAVHINQSLTTLGRVISTLVEAQKRRSQGASQGHIPYRDSRLTFLLQDSLGGNAKTMIIAAVSRSPVCAAETASTLLFVASAKSIRNKATINLNYRGDVPTMQKEIIRLNGELEALRSGFTDPAIEENKEMRGRIETLEREHVERELRLQAATAEVSRFKKERHTMERRMVDLQVGSQSVAELAERLQVQIASTEAAQAAASKAAREVEAQLDQWRLAAESAQAQLVAAFHVRAAEAESWAGVRARLEAQLAESSEAGETARAQARESEVKGAELAVLYAEASESLSEEKGARSAADAQCGELEARLAAGAAAQAAEVAELEGRLAAATASAAAADAAAVAAAAAAAADAAQLSKRASAAEGQASALEVALAEASAAAAEGEAEACALRARLSAAEDEASDLEGRLSDAAADADASAAEAAELRERLSGAEAEACALRAHAADAEAEASGLRDDVASGAAEAGSLRDRVAAVEAEADALRARVAEVEDEASGLRARAEGGDADAEALRAELAGVQAELASERALRADAAASSANAEAALTRQLEASGSDVQSLRLQLAEAELRLAAERDAAAERQSAAAETRTQLEEALEAARSDGNNALARIESLTEALAEAASEAECVLGAVREESFGHARRGDGLETAIADLTQRLASAEAAAADAASRADEVGATLNDVRAQLEAQRAAAAEAAAAHAGELAATRGQAAAAAASAESMHAERSSSLQMELMSAQDQLVVRVAELNLEVEKRKREAVELRSQLTRRDAEVAELSAELASISGDRSELEQQMKGHLVTTNRQARAFSEIMRLINWATTPPSSARSSVRGPDDSVSGVHHGDLSPECSPGPSTTAAALRHRLAANAAAAAMSSGAHGTPGSASMRANGASLHKAPSARVSLQFGAAGLATCRGEHSPVTSTVSVTGGGSALNKRHLALDVSGGAGSGPGTDDVNSPTAVSSARDQRGLE
ncbi:hypothetical protein FOA52_002829 [Chlamydomonas sp. UWO 241]|nr:hypothetical protein FOA52_002829 [Chlamydomonas sp. UWO 241]